MHAGGADTETVSKHKFIGSLLEHCQDRQVPVICAHELVPPGMHPLLSWAMGFGFRVCTMPPSAARVSHLRM
jgi:hypothetical protein